MGAGSVIHGCHEEQDIRRMGGLRKIMPVTFTTYAVGMLALSGFPLLFSGFWSKDEILHSAHRWHISHWPFYLMLCAAFLTAFYMTRQVFYVFFGNCRLKLGQTTSSEQRTVDHGGTVVVEHPHHELPSEPHESPAVMTLPLVVLAVFAIVLGFVGTPAWPWFQSFLEHEHLRFNGAALTEAATLKTMLISSVIALGGIALGWLLYGKRPCQRPGDIDVLERGQPEIFTLLRNKYYVDEAYEWAFVRFNAWWARTCDLLDTWVWNGLVQLCAYVFVGIAWVNKFLDENAINRGFDEGCARLTQGGGLMSRLQNGSLQGYLRVIGIALAVLALALMWGCKQ